jgi:hypothetical protein
MRVHRMKTVALAAILLATCVSPSFARGARPEPVRVASNAPKAAVAIGRDGQDGRLRCSAENPNIEYRDCINASTRDPNAKVRMG